MRRARIRGSARQVGLGGGRDRGITSPIACSCAAAAYGAVAVVRVRGAAMLVVMRGMRGENVPEAAATDDQDPVEAFAADAAGPGLGVRACLRRPHRRNTRPPTGDVKSSAGRRTVGLPAQLVALLRKHRAEQDARALAGASAVA